MRNQFKLKGVLLGSLLLALVGCSSGVGSDEVTESAQTEQSVVQFDVAVSKPLLDRFERLEPESRGCVLNRLDELGVLAELENASAEGRLPTLASKLGNQIVDCGSYEVEFGFSYGLPSADGQVSVKSLWTKIVNLFTDAYDKVCVEITCICSNPITGGRVTCGCPSSDVPSCSLLGMPNGCPNEPETCIDDGPERY